MNAAPVPLAYSCDPGLRALFADGETVYLGRGLDVLSVRGDLSRANVRAKVDVPAIRRFLARRRLPSRLAREELHGLVPLSDGSIIAIIRGAIVRAGPGDARLGVVHPVRRGSRPLTLCRAPDGWVSYGEYYSNPDRQEVHIYASEDGAIWDVAYTFPAGRIRHVHGVFADARRNGVWVLTGDDDTESGLWFTDDRFESLELVVGGGQATRAVSVLFHEDALILPMDTPREQNYIHRWSPNGGLERVAALPGSAFWSSRHEEFYLISTVVEPSEVNITKSATVWASRNTTDWVEIARFPRDIWSGTNGASRIMRYPQVLLPAGHGAGPHIYGSGLAVAGADKCLIEWNTAHIRKHLAADV